MKRQNKASLLIPSILAVILGLTVGTHSTHLSAEPVASAEKLEGMKMEQCEDVMKLRQQLMMGHMHSGKDSMDKCPMLQVKGEVHIE
ncbi:MAG: hypothetical protein ACAI34_11830 [Verrucomicrobium sp.]